MSVLVTLEANLKGDDEFAKFEQMGRDLLPDTRAYEGCEGITIHRNMDDPTNVVLVEHWTSREHYEKYLAWRDETGVLAQLGELLTGPPNIRFYDIVGV